MPEKNILSRIQHKHDIEANWSQINNFIPKDGELIIYDIDESHSYPRFKVGDGTSNINDLTFTDKEFATKDYVDKSIINIPTELDAIILKSSTPGSVKKFKLTVDDDGILSTEEVVE